VLLLLYKIILYTNNKKVKFNIYYIKYLGFFINIKRVKVNLIKIKFIYNNI
jgi:hypothetical protein